MSESFELASQLGQLRGDEMRTPDEVAVMLRLQALGWGERRIAAALGCNRRTVRRYPAGGGWAPYRTPRRARCLDGLEDRLAERFRLHRGNGDVVRQDLAREKGIVLSLRTVERAVAGCGGRCGPRRRRPDISCNGGAARGLRIPVATVVGMAAEGMTVAEIIAAHPDLEQDDVREALRYAAAAARERELPLISP